MNKQTITIKNPVTKNYYGKMLIEQKIEIGVYDKLCGSPSSMTIEIVETGEKRTNVTSISIEKDDLLKLKDILNSLEL